MFVVPDLQYCTLTCGEEVYHSGSKISSCIISLAVTSMVAMVTRRSACCSKLGNVKPSSLSLPLLSCFTLESKKAAAPARCLKAP